MVAMKKDEFTQTLGELKRIPHLRVVGAREFLLRGLHYFLGDNAKWVKGYDGVVDWMTDNKRRGLVVLGANGLGKSIICYEILPVYFEYYEKARKVYRTRACDLHNVVKTQADYYTLLASDVIVIDDFGVEDLTNDFGQKSDTLSNVIDIAERNKKLLIMSSNLTPQGIIDRYGQRTSDRLKAITTGVKFEGASLRGVK